MPAEEPVFEVDLGLADEVVRPEQVPVEHAHRENRVLRVGNGRVIYYKILDSEMQPNLKDSVSNHESKTRGIGAAFDYVF